ncbi:hypothetical protein GCM10009092_35390 [Bowmanella denitrificans]|uniref:Uncharacterized protein n=1 Tax=Bowmanella denitrificans TaxID=366582 RepID=A0ABN0XMG5_9ALTE
MDSNKLHITALVVEDVEDDMLLLLQELRRGGYRLQCERVDTPEALRKQLTSRKWDIVFCDYSMPQMNGRQALDIVRSIDLDVPFIFVSGSIGEDIAVEAMRTGAQDYIMKHNLKRLTPAVCRELDDAKARHERRAAELRLQFLTHYDQLTQLPNRVLFQSKLSESLQLCEAIQAMTAVVCVNLDKFKNINDSLGYDAGDLVLQEVACRLKNVLSPPSVVARFSADEFFILLPNIGSRQAVVKLMENILYSLERPFNLQGCRLYLNASVGMTLSPQDGNDAQTLLRNADIATCRVKDKGGKNYGMYTPDMTVRLEELMELEQAMRRALHNQEFQLYYQPQVSLRDNKLIGVEALIRWHRPAQGMVSPGDFIPLAEETGLIIPLGEWVLRQACIQACRWKQAGHPAFRVAVNISPLQFRQQALAEQVLTLLQEYELEPSWLELEITESVIMQDTAAALTTLNRLKQHQVHVSLDDFGTGYSSLSYLKHFKVDMIKVDQAFVKDVSQDQDDATIISAIIAMAGKLGMKVIAEGVETQHQYDFLREEGCDYIQGYLIGRPMPAEQFDAWLEQWQAACPNIPV